MSENKKQHVDAAACCNLDVANKLEAMNEINDLVNGKLSSSSYARECLFCLC